MSTSFVNDYASFEFSLLHEFFLVLRETCKTDIHNYDRHLLWHGIDICAELFRRRLEDIAKTPSSSFRQSRQFLLAWLAFIIEKVHSNQEDFAIGLCDARCYDISHISIDSNLFDRSAVGPQIPPPTRLRLVPKKNVESSNEWSSISRTSRRQQYAKSAKKPFKMGKLSSLDVVIEERRKEFDEFKEMKYVKFLLELLIIDKRYVQYEKTISICLDIITYRCETKLSYEKTNSVIVDKLPTANAEISKLTLTCLQTDYYTTTTSSTTTTTTA
jgi:hypothetical protein